MNDIDQIFSWKLSLILLKIKRNNYYFPQNQDRAEFEVIMEKYREKLSFKYQVIAKKFELNKNRWEVQPNISTSQPLPDELNTERAKKYFPRAVEAGYMELTETGYKWDLTQRGNKVKLGYFLQKVYCPNNTEEIPETVINDYFSTTRIGSSISQIIVVNKPQKWRAKIDSSIFFD